MITDMHHLPAVIDSSEPSSLPTLYTPQPDYRLTIDQMVAAWLHAKYQRSLSENTLVRYQRIVTAFRQEVLAPAGLDLDSDPGLIATLLQGWAANPFVVDRKRAPSASARQRRLDKEGGVGPGTYNGRLVPLSSFYIYGMKRGWFTSNPTKLVEPRRVPGHNYAQPLDKEDVDAALSRIDRSTLVGKRDYALLLVAFTTGRRRAELAALRWGDVTVDGRGHVTVIWRRCKGNKQMQDELAPHTAAALLDNLRALYGADLSSVPKDAPIWVRQGRNRQSGPLKAEALAPIWAHRLGTSQVHVSRHTFAVTMEESGAKLSDIGARLGHSSLATTSIYMQRLHAAKNPFAEQLEQAFGASQRETPVAEHLMTQEQRVRDAILAHPELSTAALAKLVGAHPSTIQRRRKAMGRSRPMGSNQYA